MVLSGTLFSLPYSLLWRIAQRFGKQPQLAFYCAEMVDFHCFEPVRKHLPDVTYIASDPKVRQALRNLGIEARRGLIFPRALVMCRHATHKFPCSRMLRIGLRHGAYHFKRLSKAANYNQFDLYLFTSQADLAAAEEIGVKVGKAVGFPRLDPVFNGSLPEDAITGLRRELKLDPHRPTLLFTATWDKSGMSALRHWHDRLAELTPRYNILATIHPWTDREYRKNIRSTPGVCFVRGADLIPYILLADVVIGDTSSLLADCSALGKPLITFRTVKGRRSLPEIDQLLSQISLRIKSFEELPAAVDRLLKEPKLLKQGQSEANRVMFDELDGKAGERAAAEILKLLGEPK
ncbi:MAG: CDP-glycerol glycerophosphotransferase family protein [Candidatus Syntrophosphaera sp.]|nr:CDP-glycerol glycerophosphotransferase family protein [Candidatus Syntrophosphaera sp.]